MVNSKRTPNQLTQSEIIYTFLYKSVQHMFFFIKGSFPKQVLYLNQFNNTFSIRRFSSIRRFNLIRSVAIQFEKKAHLARRREEARLSSSLDKRNMN